MHEITCEEATGVYKAIILKKKLEREAALKAAQEAAEAAAKLEAITPRELPFSLPPRERPSPPLLLTCVGEGWEKEEPSGQEQEQAIPSPATTIIIGRNSTRGKRRRFSLFTAEDDMHLNGADASQTIDVVSEYSGIGAFEHGMQAGFDEAGLSFRLIEACELESTAAGRHAAAVLRKRFPDCRVLNPTQRALQAYPPEARMLDVTAQCTEHSALNPSRKPWITEEAQLEPVIERLRLSPQIEVVVLENVPNFAKTLDGQDRSSYWMWVEGLQHAGFSEHAYVTLPTSASGDLHHRVRLLSVHTRGAFHPAAALLRLVENDALFDQSINAEEQGESAIIGEERLSSDVFAFTTGLSETRAEAKGNVGATFGSLPAYNTGLNCALYVRGTYYKLSPWLAARCSGLPDEFQDNYWDNEHQKVKNVAKFDVSNVKASALGNMVSPLQARELGNAIASEWLSPRHLADVAVLRDAPSLPQEYIDGIPFEFPISRSNHVATLCFNSNTTKRWHRIEHASWQRVQPSHTLDELCDEALARGKLKPVTNLTDLNRLVDDETLLPIHRKKAEEQYTRIQKASNDELRKASYIACNEKGRKRYKLGLTTRQVWAQCDNCLSWRRLSMPPAAAEHLPERWTCSMNPDPPFNRCDVVQEEMTESEECRSGWREESEPYTAESDRWLLTAADYVGNLPCCCEVVKEGHVRICNGSAFSPLACDYFLKSRLPEELVRRIGRLRAVRAGAESMAVAVPLASALGLPTAIALPYTEATAQSGINAESTCSLLVEGGNLEQSESFHGEEVEDCESEREQLLLEYDGSQLDGDQLYSMNEMSDQHAFIQDYRSLEDILGVGTQTWPSSGTSRGEACGVALEKQHEDELLEDDEVEDVNDEDAQDDGGDGVDGEDGEDGEEQVEPQGHEPTRHERKRSRSRQWEEGDAVEAQFAAHLGGLHWFRGRVTRVHKLARGVLGRPGRAYDISYDDGDEEEMVLYRHVREIRKDSEPQPVAKILKHHVYYGAQSGSLFNVYGSLRYADGQTTHGYYVPLESLCGYEEGPDVIAAYCRTDCGKAILKYVPSYVLSAAEAPDEAESAISKGVVEGARSRALAYAKADERVAAAEAERLVAMDASEADSNALQICYEPAPVLLLTGPEHE